MGKYLRKYNKETKQWEILSPNYSNDIFVTNPLFSSTSGSPKTLDTVLTTINDDIVKLKQNVSWLVEHGGGGNGLGGGSGSTYKFFIENGGNGDTLYVSSTPYTIQFKIVGGSPSDKVSYIVTYDGRALVGTYKECKVNTLQTVVIPDFTDGVSVHSLQFEGLDPDGMMIEPRIVNIMESSLKLKLNGDVFKYAITDSGDFSVMVTNKALESQTILTVLNMLNGKSKNFIFTTQGAGEEEYHFNLFDGETEEEKLISNVEIGRKYTFAISASTETSNGILITSNILYPEIWFTSPNEFSIVVENITSYVDVESGQSKPKDVELGSNLSFAFTIYHGGVPSVYYAIVLSKESGETPLDDDIHIFGNYYAKNEEELKLSIEGTYPVQQTGAIKRIQFLVPNSETFLGERFIKIKCWSTDFALTANSINIVNFIQSNLDVFPIQKPKRGSNGMEGHCLFMEFNVFTEDPWNAMPGNGAAITWTTKQQNYLGFNTSSNKIDLWTPETTMELYATNGLQSGFINKNGMKILRFQGDSYAKIPNPFKTDTDKTKLTTHKCFVLSIAYKSDEHPSNDKTVFEWCQYDSMGGVAQGIKVSLEKICWELYSNKDGKANKSSLNVNIQQNVDTAIDFVFIASDATGAGEKGIAKIFVNGVINAAVEVGEINAEFCNDMFIACSNKNVGQGDVLCDFSDIDFYSLRLFTGELTDVEIIVNSHNSIAERTSEGGIDNDKYKLWKNRNFLSNESETSKKPKCDLYDASTKKYKTVSFLGLQGKTPLPILYIDASKSQNINYDFNENFFYTSYSNTSITSETFTNCSLEYYDNETKETVKADNVAISLQGTSSVTYRSKNLEIYFQGECPHDPNKTQLFQPKSSWFPESQFTLKADIVDSAHANNAVLGQWINELTNCDFMKKTPAEELIEKMPPADKVVYDNNGVEEIINHNPGETAIWPNHQGLKIKNTLEGFPILLLIKFNPKGMTDASATEQLMGIYSFNLGRYSYYNLGLKFFKYFSRRQLNSEGKFENKSCPAIINYYDFYTKSEPIEKDGFRLLPRDFVSFEFGGGADENNSEYATWSQFDLSILNKVGSFRFHGAGDDPSVSPDASESAVNAWHNLRELFKTTSQCLPLSNVYSYDINSSKYIPQMFNGNPVKHTDGADAGYQKLTQQLCIPNSMVYFVVCSIFGMVDSLSKNFTLRSWNCDSTNAETRGATVWYPCFYDMDTALGLTNEGEEIVSYDAYVDKFYNTEIEWVDGKPQNINKIQVSANFSSEQEQNRYGGYNSKLWRILRKKNDTSLATIWDEKNASALGSNFKQRAQYEGYYYEEVYRDLRQEGGLLSKTENFIDKFTGQTKNCGEIIFNFDYTLKYLTKYVYKQGDTEILGLGNIKMLHGNRKEYVRNWLNNRLLFLDGVFEIDAYGVLGKPISQNGTFTFAGNVQKSGKPYFTFMVTNPAFLNVSVGQSTADRYYLKPYTDTIIVFTDTSSTKQASINNNALITKFDGLRDYRLNKFETLNLPKLTKVDFSNITTFYKGTPIQFHTVFTFDTGLLDEEGRKIFSSNVREIDLSNAKQNGGEVEGESGTFNIQLNTEGVDGSGKKIIYNFDRLKKINIFNSCVSQLTLPSTILEELNVKQSDITHLNIENQPLLDQIDVTGCNKLIGINIQNCVKITSLNFNDMTELTGVTIGNCENLTSISLTGNTKLQKIIISDCSKLTSISLNGNIHQSLEIGITTCNNLVTFNATGLKTSNRLKLPLKVDKITTFNVSGWDGLKEIQYGSNSNEYEVYNEDIGGVHKKYTDSGSSYCVLDLSPMTKIKSISTAGSTTHYYKNLLTSRLGITNCPTIETIKFRNDIDNPFVLNVANSFSGCTALRRVFGHVALHGNGDFKNNTYFQIHSDTKVEENIVDECVQYNEADFKAFKTDIFDTNFRLCKYSTAFTETFRNTSCSLYDAYYIFYKCNIEGNKVVYNGKTYNGDDVTYANVRYNFRECPKIKFTSKNNLNVKTYYNCKVTNSFSNPFYGCSGNSSIIFYSPNSTNNNRGTLTPILENGLLNLNEIHGYCDEDVFKLPNKTNTITAWTWSNLYYVDDVNAITLQRKFVKDYDIFKYLPNLKQISNIFTSDLYIEFSPQTIYVDKEGIKVSASCTTMLYNLTQLINIENSFINMCAKGQIKNMFGYGGCKKGYSSASSSTQMNIYPQSLSKVIYSFTFGTPGDTIYPRLYITNDMFSNIKTTLQYFSNGITNICEQSQFVFSGKVTKYIPDGESFPYEILKGCTALREAPGLLSNLQYQGANGMENVTIPNYVKDGVRTSMFEDCKYITNIGYFFYNMQDISYELNSNGFNHCSLVNVEKCFGYSNHHDFSATMKKRRKGAIPYGLFKQNKISNFTTTKGFTEEQANALGINETWGIKNPVYDEQGNVTKKVTFNSSKKNSYGLSLITGGNTYPDKEISYTIEDIIDSSKSISQTFKYSIDDYGVILDGYGGTSTVANESDYRPCIKTGQTTFSGTYSTFNATIENMNGCFQYNDGDGLTSYEIGKDIDEMALIVDNENYNTIKYLVNSAYNPILYLKKYNSDTKVITFVRNDSYDPRRFIKNPNWNKYSKKVNKFYHDGVTDCSEYLTNVNIDPKTISEIEKGYHSEDTPIDGSIYSTDRDNLKAYVGNRNFAFAPDVVLYCKNINTVNIKNLFAYAGGQNINLYQNNSSCFDYLKYGLRGTIPPFMFEKLTEITAFDGVFNGCRGIMPDAWGKADSSLTQFTQGRILPNTLFKNNKNVTSMKNTFANMVFYPSTYLRPDIDIDSHVFAHLTKLKDMESCFALTYWFGGETAKDGNGVFYNPLFSDEAFKSLSVSRDQLANNPFQDLTNLEIVTNMFMGGITTSESTPNRTDLQCFNKNIFNNNTKLKNVSGVFSGCWRLTEVNGDGLIEFWGNTYKQNPKVTSCYAQCIELKKQLNDNDKWKTQYEQYFL